MIDIAMLRAMASAGASVEMILMAVELAMKPEMARRANNAERARRYRERHATSRDVTSPSRYVTLPSRYVTLPSRDAQGPLEEEERKKESKKEERERPLTRPARKRAAPAPKIRLPDNWVPREEDHVPEDAPELAKMRDWAASNAIAKADWDATWRNWRRRAPAFARNGSGKSLVDALKRDIDPNAAQAAWRYEMKVRKEIEDERAQNVVNLASHHGIRQLPKG